MIYPFNNPFLKKYGDGYLHTVADTWLSRVWVVYLYTFPMDQLVRLLDKKELEFTMGFEFGYTGGGFSVQLHQFTEQQIKGFQSIVSYRLEHGE